MIKRYSTIFTLIALFVIIYTGVDLFYRIVRAQLRQVDAQEIITQQNPDVKHSKRPPLNDFQPIIQRNIFGSVEKASEEIKAAEIETLEPTSLKIALLGTVTGNPQNAVAIIEETDKRKQGLYRLGDSVQNAIVKMILRGKVVLKVGDRDEILTMEESFSSKSEKRGTATSPKRRESTITVKLSDLERSLKNINKLLTQARVRPHFKDGKADGLALSRVRANSFFRKMGLRDGDIVQGINGRPITSPDDILSLYDKLRAGSQISLQINRRGQERTINYKFR